MKQINELRKLSTEDLKEKLEELKEENLKQEIKMFNKTGSSTIIRNYPTAHEENKFGNISKIKKNIARIKTILAERSKLS